MVAVLLLQDLGRRQAHLAGRLALRLGLRLDLRLGGRLGHRLRRHRRLGRRLSGRGRSAGGYQHGRLSHHLLFTRYRYGRTRLAQHGGGNRLVGHPLSLHPIRPDTGRQRRQGQARLIRLARGCRGATGPGCGREGLCWRGDLDGRLGLALSSGRVRIAQHQETQSAGGQTESNLANERRGNAVAQMAFGHHVLQDVMRMAR
ncbi:hypothetical protein D3C78_1113710 [compost metagenome]